MQTSSIHVYSNSFMSATVLAKSSADILLVDKTHYDQRSVSCNCCVVAALLISYQALLE